MDVDVSTLVPNGRWVGDLPTSSGRRIRPRAILRCGELDAAPVEAIRALTRLQPGVIVDLRSDRELTRPHPLGEHRAYRHRPFIDERRDQERDPTAERSRADLYVGSLRRNRRTVAAAVRAILDAPPGPIVLHCKSGVDRTGMLVAILLAGLRVDRALIAKEYAEYRADRGPQTGDPPDAQTMATTLAHLERQHGGASGYLRDCGLDAVGDRLADRLVA